MSALKFNIENMFIVADKSLKVNETERKICQFELHGDCVAVDIGLTGDDIGKMFSKANEIEVQVTENKV